MCVIQLTTVVTAPLEVLNEIVVALTEDRGGWTRSRVHKKSACCPICNTVQNVSHDLKP